MMCSRFTYMGIALLCAFSLVTGCNQGVTAASPTANATNHANQTVHTDTNGFPIAPYVYQQANTTIVPADSWNHITTSFGYSGIIIEGKNQQDWAPLSLIQESLTGAGLTISIKKQTLNVKVPSSIGVDELKQASNAASGSKELTIVVNGHAVAMIPWLKADQLSDTYVPITRLIKVLGGIHMDMRWKPAQGQTPGEWDIGSPIYGLVTTGMTLSPHATSTRSAITIIHRGDNWIPYDYIANSLGNAQAGITVNILGDFAGINMTVPASIPVDMKQLPSVNSSHKNEVPIEINGRVVSYAFSYVPKFGPQTGYLSSAEVMSAIRRIGLTMHWGPTDGDFTTWNITTPKAHVQG